MAKSLGDNALAEARVGLAGPVLGTLGSGVVPGDRRGDRQRLLARARATSGFFLNLFNLLPVVPLDGGRAMAAMAPWMWFVGFGALVALAFIDAQPILLIILLFGGDGALAPLAGSAGRARSSRPPTTASRRATACSSALVYVGLIVVLALGMAESHILSSAGHSFRSI